MRRLRPADLPAVAAGHEQQPAAYGRNAEVGHAEFAPLGPVAQRPQPIDESPELDALLLGDGLAVPVVRYLAENVLR